MTVSEATDAGGSVHGEEEEEEEVPDADADGDGSISPGEDADGDGFCAWIDTSRADHDLCPDRFDLIQSDADGDGLGDGCDPDNDGARSDCREWPAFEHSRGNGRRTSGYEAHRC